MTTDSAIQLLTEGTGPKVRTLKQVDPAGVDASGSAQADSTRHQQITSLADRHGDVVDLSIDELILEELRTVREVLQVISAQLG